MTDIKQLPKDFLKEMKDLLGEEYEDYLDSFQEEWKPGLRVNTLKTAPEDLKAWAPWELQPVPWTNNGFYYERGGAEDGLRPSRHPAYSAGLYYLQEPSAMAPAALLPIDPGDRVLDLCAAPGGKSTELAAKLQGQGMLVSNDISCSRARGLLKNLELAGISNICVTSESPERLATVWPGFFDKILVDAPCSGEGMFRRDENMVKDWTQRGPGYYAPIQRQIASQAIKMLKPGGMMLYSTCTFSKAEDEDNIRFLLDTYADMELCPLDLKLVPGACGGIGLNGCVRLFPHRLKGEGHFMALLRRQGELQPGCQPEKDKDPGVRPGAWGKIPHEVMDFLQRMALDWDESRLVVHQNHVYYLPEGLSWNLPLRFLRTGLLLGEIKRERFEPSQALAMALKAEQFPKTVYLDMDDERVIRYLKGETIARGAAEDPGKGWCLVTAGGYPLGWAKGSGMNLKNKYYPGWRWQ